MSYIVFEICKGVRSEVAIFPKKEKAAEVVSLLFERYANDVVRVDYEITDLWGNLVFSSAHAITTLRIADATVSS